MNARWYLPGLGRFISADTIVPNPTNPQSYNRYSYVRNQPLNFTDPTGHRQCGASNDCSDPLPPTSTFQEALLQAWIYYEDNFDFPFEGTQNITQGFGRDHDGVDYGGEFTVHAPASGVVEQDTFRDPPAGMWMIQNSTTGEILTWSRWRTDPGWQGELYESNRGSDGLLEPERLLRTGEWDDIRNANPNTEPNWSHTTGTMIKLNHSHGLATTYIHTVPTLTVGQQVEQGDTLGVTANNGWSSGTHLHYRLEFTYGGRTIYLNPLAPPRQIAHLLP